MTSSVKPNRDMRRAQLKKSHSWWWDSHVSPKNSRWLAENLEEMDQSVKRMLKLIEEDGDSFAKKAEMYYQKRPELIAHVEEFYRIYRSLAERYDHVTGELRKNIPLDLQSQGSSISDVGSEQPSMLPPSDQRLSRRKSGPRAAGFEVFLGTGGSSSDLCDKGDETSTLDSESESDDSSVNNYSGQSANGDDQVLRRKVVESDVDLHDVKEKLRIQQEENGALLARVAGYEEELRTAKENIHVAHEQIAMLRTLQGEIDKTQKQGTEVQEVKEGSETGVTDPEKKMRMLEEELRVTKVKLSDSEREVAGLKQHLNDQLGSAKKDTSGWKVKLDKEKREVSKLQDRIARYKANLAEREQEIRALKETVSNANKSLSEENVQLQTEMTKLVKERAYLEDNLKEWDLRCQSVEEELRRAKAGKAEMEALFTNEIEKLKGDVVARDDRVEELNKSVDLFTLKYNTLLKETDELNIKVANLTGGVNSKDDQIVQMSKHLHELHIEHVELIGESERARKLTEEMRTRVDELEKEVERQKEVIMEGAEEKREAIRQLCFSIEHYRDGYKQLRQAFVGHRRLPVMAS